MANNYLQFSEVLPQLTVEERDWLQNQLEYVSLDDEGKEIPADQPIEDAKDAAFQGPRFLSDYEDYEGDESCGFDHKFDTDADWGEHLWIYTEESGSPDRVAWLIQKFLKRFRSESCWWLTYATTCSKMRPSEFGGGGVFVTAEEIFWENAYSFVEQHRAEWTKTHPQPPSKE